MAYYMRVRTVVEVSANADYSNPQTHVMVSETTPTAYTLKSIESCAITTGTDISTSHLTTITDFCVKNLDIANKVTVTWVDSNGTGGVQDVLAEQSFRIPDVDASTDPNITATTAAVLCEISYGGV